MGARCSFARRQGDNVKNMKHVCVWGDEEGRSTSATRLRLDVYATNRWFYPLRGAFGRREGAVLD